MDLECLLNDLNDSRSLIKEVSNGRECNVEMVFSEEFLNISSSIQKIGKKKFKEFVTSLYS